jgi:hypothetical protein
MTDFAIIVDKKTGFKTQESPVIVLEDGEYLSYELKDNEAAIPIDNNIGDQTVGMNKPQWNFDTKEWVDIEPLPPIKPKPPVPNEMEVLNEQVVALEKENKLLKAQVEVLSQTADFHEELIAEMAMQVYA